MPGPLPPPLPAGRRRSWFARHWFWLIPAILGFCAAMVFGIVALVFGFIKASDVYQLALDRAQASPSVQARLGTPIEDGFLVSGNIQVTNNDGEADLQFRISGPEGAATVFAKARKRSGSWTFQRLVIRLADGEVVDLQRESDGGG